MKRLNLEPSNRLKDVSLAKVIAAAVVCAAVLTYAMFSPMLDDANLYLSDTLYQRANVLDGSIAVLGIDERALENLGPFNTWTRSTMADIIDALNVSEDCKPAVIGIDVMYFGNSTETHDQRLAEACGRYGNVVVASNAVFSTSLVENENGFYLDNNSVKQFETPYDGLRAVTGMGHINTMFGNDGIVRHALKYIDLPQDMQSGAGITRSESFAFQIYQKYIEQTGLPDTANAPLGQRNEWYIPYSATPGGYYDGSVWDLLSGDIPGEAFANRIVLIGPYTVGLQDNFVVPIYRTGQMYGVEIHANIVDAMLRGEYRLYVSKTIAIGLTFLLLFALFFPFYFWNAFLSAPLMLGASGLYLFIAQQLVFPFNENWFLFNINGTIVRYMLPPLYFPLGAFVLYIGLLAVNFLTTQKQKRQVTDTFKKYVDPAIIEDIFKTGLDHMELGGRKADVCVMFVDIRGFTPMSEVMQPEEVVSMLGEYLELTSSAIFKHKGTLDKFIGDATMAFWGAPVPHEDYIYNAVLAAWDIVQSGMAMEKKLQERYGRTVSFGIGLHCGEAVVGNIGTMKRVDYTAIGNTVNTAARLESNARPAQVLISQAVYQALEGRISARCVGNIPLKGKSEELTVYALEHIHAYANDFEPLASAQLKPGK